jgi:YbgC/YbaW family acyl-CoA thioester hydrolase
MSGRPFVIDEYVRWSDVDYAGIIFYGSYVRFFEIAETELFRAAGLPYREVFDRFAIWLPRVHLACDFTYPARLDDRLRVAAYFTHFGTSSIRINFDVQHVAARQMAARGHEVLVCVDRGKMRPRPLPEELRRSFGPFVLSESDARTYLESGQSGGA